MSHVHYLWPFFFFIKKVFLEILIVMVLYNLHFVQMYILYNTGVCVN